MRRLVTSFTRPARRRHRRPCQQQDQVGHVRAFVHQPERHALHRRRLRPLERHGAFTRRCPRLQLHRHGMEPRRRRSGAGACHRRQFYLRRRRNRSGGCGRHVARQPSCGRRTSAAAACTPCLPRTACSTSAACSSSTAASPSTDLSKSTRATEPSSRAFNMHLRADTGVGPERQLLRRRPDLVVRRTRPELKSSSV